MKLLEIKAIDATFKAEKPLYVKGGFTLQYEFEGKGAYTFIISPLLSDARIAHASISNRPNSSGKFQWHLWGKGVSLGEIVNEVGEEALDLKKFAKWVGENLSKVPAAHDVMAK